MRGDNATACAAHNMKLKNERTQELEMELQKVQWDLEVTSNTIKERDEEIARLTDAVHCAEAEASSKTAYVWPL